MLFQKIKYTGVLILAGFCFSAEAQVEINKNIVLTGTDTADRQVRRVNQALDSTNMVSAATYQEGLIHFGNASSFSTDSILVTASISFSSYEAGLQFNFTVPNNNHDSVFVNVNGAGWVKLKYKNRSLTPGMIKPGMMLQTVYDGTAFQVLNVLEKTCPIGFKDVNLSYCIEQNEGTLKTFFDASVDCGSKNARLCTWNEWYHACQKTSLGLSNMTNNYEWIDSSGNNNHQAAILGNGNCTVRALATDTTTSRYRCCYSK